MNYDTKNSGFFHALIKHSTSLIIVTDTAGIYKYVSNSTEKLTGYRSEELLGKALMEHIHNDDLRAMKEVFLQLDTLDEVEAPLFRFRKKDGSWRWMEATIINGTEDGHIDGYVINARDVTQKQEELLRLEKGSIFYNSVYQSHPDAVFTLTPEGSFENINPNFSRMLSYNNPEVVGEHISKFIAPSFTYESLIAMNKAKNFESSSLEGKVIDKHGRVKTLSFTFVPIYTNRKVVGILGVAKDVSAEKSAQRELEKLSLIPGKAMSSVVITDAQGRIEWVNSEFTRVTGYKIQEAVGKKYGELLQGPETAPSTVQEINRLYQNQGNLSVEVLNYRKSGEKFWSYTDFTPILNDEGQVSQYFSVQFDITERKEAEEKMRLLSEDLTRQNRELLQFNYIVSHNLRSPVANITGLVSLLEKLDKESDNYQKVIDRIRQTSLGLDTVMKDLDEILSLHDREGGESQEIVCLKPVCDEVTNSLQDRMETLEATVQVAIPVDVCISANRAYVYSIFHNLISNSLKYRSPDRTPVVSITYAREDNQHVIRLQDNGVGMDLKKHGDRLFKLYGKLEKRTEGRGLGLYMVKAQVESLGGTIEVESTPGLGTTFIIRFNIEQL